MEESLSEEHKDESPASVPQDNNQLSRSKNSSPLRKSAPASPEKVEAESL
jgi:hypothetical protein